jgi:hypothetical protein
MRRKRLAVIAGLMVVAVLVTSAVAFADGQTNGTGKSNLGFTVGYNAKSDLTGNFEYQPTLADGTALNIHCNDYTRYHETTADHGAHPKTIFNSTYCYDGDTRYFVHVEAIDRGEGSHEDPPGDALCITVALFPARSNPVLVKDCGPVQKGNVQIHTDPDSLVDTQLIADPTTP